MASLISVSCYSVGNCLASGSYEADYGRNPLLVSETDGTWGSGWAAPALPSDPSIGSSNPTFVKVSCSAQVCAAVGQVDTTLTSHGTIDTTEGYIVVGSGDSWTALLAPLPPDAAYRAGAVLDDVSCAGAECEAVGHYTTALGDTQGLLLSYTSGSWTASDAPLPGGAATTGQDARVDAVACPGAGKCSAAGSYTDASATQKPLLLSESAGNWSATAGHLPTGSPHNPRPVFKAIDCSRAGDCAAVGFDDADKHHNQVLPLAVAEKGGDWKAAVNPDLPANATALSTNRQQAGLLTVSCPAPSRCEAGGFYTAANGSAPALLATFGASGWSAGMEAPLPTDANPGENQAARVFGLSCGDASGCEGVGWYKGPFGQFDRALILGSGNPSVGVAQASRARIVGHTARVPISCRGRTSCSVTLMLAKGTNGKLELGRTTATAKARHSKVVRIKLNAQGLKLLAGKRSLSILLSVSQRASLVSAQQLRFRR
jgi:hypothetical protein